MKNRQGLTLAELLVAAVVGLLLLGLGAQIWKLERKAWTGLGEAQEAQSSCLTASQSVRKDFENALPDSLQSRRAASDFEFGFLWSEGLWDETGEARPRGWILYRYLSGKQTLERLVIPLASGVPTAAPPLPVWQGRGHVVARHLDRADFTSLHPNQLSLECHSLVGTHASGTRIRVIPRLWAGP